MKKKQYTQSYPKGRRGGEALVFPSLLLITSQFFSVLAIDILFIDPPTSYHIQMTELEVITTIVILLALPLSLLLPFFFLPTVIQRLHDINTSGWFSLFFLIPLLNTFTALFLLALPGDEKENKYGAVPTPKKVTHLIIKFFSGFLLFLLTLLLLA